MIVMPRSDGPAQPRTVASRPPSLIAGSTAASRTAASISPSTPPGTIFRMPAISSSPRGTNVSAPSSFTGILGVGELHALHVRWMIAQLRELLMRLAPSAETDVGGVHGRGGHTHPYFSRARLRLRQLRDLHHLWSAKPAKAHRPHRCFP